MAPKPKQINATPDPLRDLSQSPSVRVFYWEDTGPIQAVQDGDHFVSAYAVDTPELSWKAEA